MNSDQAAVTILKYMSVIDTVYMANKLNHLIQSKLTLGFLETWAALLNATDAKVEKATVLITLKILQLNSRSVSLEKKHKKMRK